MITLVYGGIRVMKRTTTLNIKACLAALVFAYTGMTHAGPIDIFEFSVYMNSTETGASSLRNTAIGLGPDTFTPGLDISFDNNLNADNVGTMTWSMTNSTGMDLTNVSLFGFLDADLDETLNTFFNESGFTSDLVLGTGSGDGLVDSFEIDEPGFLFGNIIGNLLAGSLDGTNSVAAGSEDDVSMALGFDIGSLLAGQSIVATFDISLSNNNGLGHTDLNSGSTFWYNGNVSINDPNPMIVAEPITLSLLFAGFLAIVVVRRFRITRFSPLAAVALAITGGTALSAQAADAVRGGGPITVDENSPECSCFDPKIIDSRDYDGFIPFPGNFVFCEAQDSRPSEDVNGNGILDPGEDLNGNNQIDADTGIFSVGLQPGAINMEIFTFFTPGDPFVFIELQTDSFDQPASAVIEITDGAGNTCLPAVQLGPFNPGGGTTSFPPIAINIPIPVPTNPGGIPPLTFQCEDFPPFDFEVILPGAFDGNPINLITSDPAVLPNHEFGGLGPRLLCCQFSDVDSITSPPFCGPVNIEPSMTPPPEPTNLRGRPKPAKIDLLWDGVDVADEYVVSRSVFGGTPSPIATLEGTLYVDFDVEPAVTYTYTVQTVQNGELSVPSKPLSVFIPAVRGGSDRGITKPKK